MKRESLLPLAAAGVLVAFVSVSLLVWITRGRSGRLVRRKLALGALLIGLTAVATGCGDGDDGVTCYLPPPPSNTVELAGLYQGHILSVPGAFILGTIVNREGTTFSYRILDADSGVVQSGDIAAADGAFDQGSEEFTFQLDPGLALGEYTLRIYAVAADQVGPQTAALVDVPLHLAVT